MTVKFAQVLHVEDTVEDKPISVLVQYAENIDEDWTCISIRTYPGLVDTPEEFEDALEYLIRAQHEDKRLDESWEVVFTDPNGARKIVATLQAALEAGGT